MYSHSDIAKWSKFEFKKATPVEDKIFFEIVREVIRACKIFDLNPV